MPYDTMYRVGLIAGVLALVFGPMGGAQYMLGDGEASGVASEDFQRSNVSIIDDYIASNYVTIDNGVISIEEGRDSGNISYNVSNQNFIEVRYTTNNAWLEAPIKSTAYPSGATIDLKQSGDILDVGQYDTVVFHLQRTDSFPDPKITQLRAGNRDNTNLLEHLERLTDLPGFLQYIVGIPMVFLIGYFIIQQVNPLA